MRKGIIILLTILLFCSVLGCGANKGIQQPSQNGGAQTPTNSAPQMVGDTDVIDIISAYDIGQDDKPDPLAEAELDGSLGGFIPLNQEYIPMHSDALLAALNDPALSDAIFDVWVLIIFDERVFIGAIVESFVYEGLNLEQWHDEYITCLRAREAYKMGLHSKLDNVPYFDKWSGGSEEAIELEAQWDAQWEADWLGEHPGKLYPMTAYRDAQEAETLVLDESKRTFLEAEFSRFESIGIYLEEVENDRLFSARLTREQALNFPLGENIITYTMLFAYEEKWSFHNYFDHDGYNDDEPIDDNGELTIDCNE